MDPYKLGTFDEQDEDATIRGLPIIRVVAALASKVPLTKQTKKVKEKQKGKQTKKETGKQQAVSRPQRPPRSYTAYDFYCGGLTPADWGPMIDDPGYGG